MSLTRPAPLAKTEQPTAQIAKAALRRLALERLEPTPEHYERAYRQESGEPPADANEDSAGARERIARSLGHALTQALPEHDGANQDLARELARVVERIDGKATARPLADDVEALARRVERVLQHRHHLFDQLGKLCHELTSS